MERWFVCPMPQEWARIHRRLLRAWRRSGVRCPEPPRPLILNGWVATDDWEKAHRWAETIEWAKRWQLDDLLPEIPEGRRYYTTDEQAQRSREGLWDEIKEFKQRYPDDDAAMPTVLRWRGYRFHLYSREPDEPPHVHVTKAGAQAKVWLSDGTVARSLGYPDRELNELCRKVREHRDELLKAWHDYFGQA